MPTTRALLLLALAACQPIRVDLGETEETDDTHDGAAATFGSGSAFTSVDEMLDYQNEQRQGYESHERWRGFPFGAGEYHSEVTWPMTMGWSEAAAGIAQAEADAVAGGATPQGDETEGNPGVAHLFVSGLDTAEYMVSGPEEADSFGTEACAICNSNPFMRMAVIYHDPGGQGPVLTTMGIGAADLGNGDTWWVFRFDE